MLPGARYAGIADVASWIPRTVAAWCTPAAVTSTPPCTSGAFGDARRSVSDLVARADDLTAALRAHFPGERRADEFHDRLAEARRAS